MQFAMTRFDDEFLEKSRARVLALQARLSRDALEELSREVMARLTQKGDQTVSGSARNPGPARIEALCQALIAQSPQEVKTMMLDLQEDGHSLDLLFARYLAPAAEMLGQMWDRDELTFLQVTLGVGRIYDLVRLLRDRLPPPRITRSEPVLFASVPGDDHNIGLEMAAELFRQHGWHVNLMLAATHDDIIAEIDRVSCIILGLSSGGAASADALARLVHAVRVAYPKLYIIVSGRIVVEEPDLVDLIGPDSAVATVEEALETMDRLTEAGLNDSH